MSTEVKSELTTDEFLNHWHEAADPAPLEGDSPASPESMTQINRMIQSLLDEAPSDAVVEFKMRKTKSEYLGLIKISSQQRKFVGGSRRAKFADVMDEIFSEVHQQILDWKSDRAPALENADH